MDVREKGRGEKQESAVAIVTMRSLSEEGGHDSLYTLITFQGQESWMQVTRIALWTKSQWAQGVFY